MDRATRLFACVVLLWWIVELRCRLLSWAGRGQPTAKADPKTVDSHYWEGGEGPMWHIFRSSRLALRELESSLILLCQRQCGTRPAPTPPATPAAATARAPRPKRQAPKVFQFQSQVPSKSIDRSIHPCIPSLRFRPCPTPVPIRRRPKWAQGLIFGRRQGSVLEAAGGRRTRGGSARSDERRRPTIRQAQHYHYSARAVLRRLGSTWGSSTPTHPPGLDVLEIVCVVGRRPLGLG